MPSGPHEPHSHAPIEEHQPHPDVEAFGGLPGRRGVLTGAAALAAAGLAAPAYADDELDKRWEVQDGRHSFATRQRPTMGRRSLKFSDKELTKQVHKGINLSSNHTLTQPISPRR